MEQLHDLIREQFLAELTAGNEVDMNNPVFKALPYGDQLGILDDVREIYRFGRSNITPYVRLFINILINKLIYTGARQ